MTKRIYINGMGSYSPEIQKYIDRIGYNPVNVKDGGIEPNLRKVFDSDAIYLTRNWSVDKGRVLAMRLASHCGLLVYKEKELSMMERLDVAMVDLFQISIRDMRVRDKRPLVSDLRSCYVGYALGHDVRVGMLSEHMDRHLSNIRYLNHRHQNYLLYDTAYRARYKKLDKYMKSIDLPEINECDERNEDKDVEAAE